MVDGINIGLAVGLVDAKIMAKHFTPTLPNRSQWANETQYKNTEEAMIDKDRFTKFWFDTYGKKPTDEHIPFPTVDDK